MEVTISVSVRIKKIAIFSFSPFLIILYEFEVTHDFKKIYTREA